MTIQQAIEKAQEQMWRPSPQVDVFIDKVYGEGDQTHLFDVPGIFLDPSFWQSLGKALGWDWFEDGRAKDIPADERSKWLYMWHRFIDHLAKGGTPESFFEKL